MSRHTDAKAIALGMAALPAAALALLVVSAIGPSQYEIEQAQLTDYCQAVEQWQGEAAQGIAPSQRFGHPDYDHKAHLCNSYEEPHGGQLAAR